MLQSRRVRLSGFSPGHRHCLWLGVGVRGQRGSGVRTAVLSDLPFPPQPPKICASPRGRPTPSPPSTRGPEWRVFLPVFVRDPAPAPHVGPEFTRWGWGPWVIYEGSSRDSDPSSQEENHQACNARPHLAPGATRTHARAAAILVPAKPAPALRPSTAPARASAGSAPRPAGPLRI